MAQVSCLHTRGFLIIMFNVTIIINEYNTGTEGTVKLDCTLVTLTTGYSYYRYRHAHTVPLHVTHKTSAVCCAFY